MNKMSSSVLMLIILAARLLCMLARKCSCDPIFVPCNFKDIHCPLRDNCNSYKENVALGKETRFRSVLQVERIHQRNLDVLGCVAVNGNINPHFQAVRLFKNTMNANCFLSGETDYTPYWQVDLGRTYTISEITIVVDAARKNLMLNVEVYVNDRLCYKFTSLTIVHPYMSHIRCNTPISGNIVKLAKTTPREQRVTPDIMLAFCEVQVWVCNRGLYGQHCDKNCSKSCNNCDNYNGECGSCDTGYYGIHCTELCRCSNKGCNRDGICYEIPTTTTSFAKAVLEAINSPGLSESPGSKEKTQKHKRGITFVIVIVVVGTLGLFFIGVGIYCCCKKRTAAGVDYTIIPQNGSKRKGPSIHIGLPRHSGSINISENNMGPARYWNGSKRKGSSMKKGRSRHRDDLDISENRIRSTRYSNDSKKSGSKRKKGRSRHRGNLYITENTIGSSRDVNASHYCNESDCSFYSGFRQITTVCSPYEERKYAV